MLTAIVAVLLTWWRITSDRSKLEVTIAEQLRAAGGDVERDRDSRITDIYVFHVNESNPEQWSSLTRLRRILSFDSDCTDADLKTIAKCRSIQELELNGGSYSGEGLAQLSSLSELRTLSLKGLILSTDHISKMNCAPSLRTLRVALKDSAIKELAGKGLLRQLDVLEVQLVADTPLNAASPPTYQCHQLDLLNVRGGGVFGLGQLLRLIEGSVVVELIECELSPAIMSQLAQIRRLKHLVLTDCAIDNHNTAEPAAFDDLESLTISGSRFPPSAIAILHSPQLKRLNLSSSSVGDEVEGIAEAFPSLRNVTVSRGRVSVEGINRLRESYPRVKIDVVK